MQELEAALLDAVEAAQVHAHPLEREAGLDLVAVLAEELEIVHGSRLQLRLRLAATARAMRRRRRGRWRASSRERV